MAWQELSTDRSFAYMEKLSISDIVPEQAEVKLQNGKTLTLGKCTIVDSQWMTDTWGESIQKVFNDLEVKSILRIAWRLLIQEDKAKFPQKEISEITEDGLPIVKKIGGLELFKLEFQGPADLIGLVNALMKTIGVSQPLMDKIEANSKKKEQAEQPTGDISLTPSLTNTDGPQNISAP